MVPVLFGVVALIWFAVVLNEIMKHANRPEYDSRNVRCRVCGVAMNKVSSHWAYRLPFEVWAVVAKYNLKSDVVHRYLCPDKHSQAWFIPRDGQRNADVLVMKDYRVG